MYRLLWYERWKKKQTICQGKGSVRAVLPTMLSSRMLFRSYMFCYATKKQEYSEKGTPDEHSNIQQTTAFETVNSKTRKETHYKNLNYGVHQLDEVNESYESFKNS